MACGVRVSGLGTAQVTKCMSGFEALQLLQTRGYLPDLLLLDYMMPGMSGLELCQVLRRSYPSNALPIIMVSAKGQVTRHPSAPCFFHPSAPFACKRPAFAAAHIAWCAVRHDLGCLQSKG
eukprot:3226586-Rhodomonas_salina.1